MNTVTAEQFVRAQFPKRLESFAEDLYKQKNEFQMAMIMQIARDVDRQCMDLVFLVLFNFNIVLQASLTQEEFLQKRLGPATGRPLGGTCLEGTRVEIMYRAKSWLKDTNANENIMWIVGAPGAGKSTIATTIAKHLACEAPYCVKFFCKRDVPDLRDPRRIWRTVAFGLAENHEGVKSALMRTLTGSKGKPEDQSVDDQFDKLVHGPINTDSEETRFRAIKYPYPVIIIDALDECYPVDEDYNDWNCMLSSIQSWSRLSKGLKLIVTSRDHPDIREALGTASRHVRLPTGVDVSGDAGRDIRLFFETNFARVRKDFKLSADWPSKSALQEVTKYAAGLFIWANMVVKYVGSRSGGADPKNRLEVMLSRIKSQPSYQRGELVSAHQVDDLYAVIIFEALLYSELGERAMARRVLATVVLAKEPLQMSSLVELLGTDDACGDIRQPIESTLRALSSIIPVFNDDIRVCHKTVSDFLLSRGRSEAAMTAVMDNWNSHRWDPPRAKCSAPVCDFIIEREAAENKKLAIACLRLIRRSFLEDISSIAEGFQRSNGPFSYARRYWVEHLEGAAGEQVLVLKSLLGAMQLADRKLLQYSREMTQAKDSAQVLIESFGRAVDLVSQWINDHGNIPIVPRK